MSAYDQLVAAGELRPDPDQRAAAQQLADLRRALAAKPQRGSLLWRLAGRKPDAPRGIYLWGGVGRGKSMLMDLFYDHLSITRKRRVHFHAFMAEVHARLKLSAPRKAAIPLPPSPPRWPPTSIAWRSTSSWSTTAPMR